MAGLVLCHYNMLLSWLMLVIPLANAAFIPHPTTVSSELLCPEKCRCLEKERIASCLLPYSEFSLEALSPWNIKSLELFQNERKQNNIVYPSLKSALYDEDSKQSVTNLEYNTLGLRHLVHLDISNVAIFKLRDFAFTSMPDLRILRLTYDSITAVERYAFAGLTNLRNLSLQNNSISSLPAHVFDDLVQLTMLDLSENNLKMVEVNTFDKLANLQILDLSRNGLLFISKFAMNLTFLKELDLSYNSITYILNDTVDSLLSVDAVKLKGNPFECSCAISGLILAAQSNMSFVNTEKIKCSGPRNLIGQSFKYISVEDLPCEEARIETVSDDFSAQHLEFVTLNCSVTGSPPLAVFWVTPWGDNFTHPRIHGLLPEYITNVKYDSHYAGVNLPLETRVYVTENGSLHIEKFRGFFSGNFTCMAKNLLGVDEAEVEIAIFTNFKSIYYISLYVGAICALAMFVIGTTIGGIRWCVGKCFHPDECNCCCCSNDDEFVDPKDMFKVPDQEIEVKNGEICVKRYSGSDDDDDKDFYEDSPPKTPFNSPTYQTPEESPGKCHTPEDEPIEPEGWISARILDQLDEVRSRLRCGAERKMMKVRSLGKSFHESSSHKIKTIKETGSLKIQSIKETSSQAASAVMKSVESGMEQVKYGYQSIKEFCGTSDMGPGTISMISVSTDVDTKEQVRVVKSHTFV